jgi:hypothetical protein
VGLGAVAIGVASRGPDFRVSFERQVHSSSSAERLRKSLFRIKHWPAWHHQATGARLKNATEPGRDQGDQPAEVSAEITAGSRVILQIDPRGQPWRRFELGIRVLEANPSTGTIRLKLEDDPKGKISALLRDLEWTLTITPDAQGSRIVGEIHGDTRSARARFFGRVAPRTLMHQVFYPDLQKLGGIESAQGLDLSPR